MVENYLDGWKRILDFSGKSNRTQFWTFYIINWVLDILLAAILSSIPIVGTVVSVLVFIAGLSISIRRLHDAEKSGWNMLWLLLPIIGWIILLVFWLTPSK